MNCRKNPFWISARAWLGEAHRILNLKFGLSDTLNGIHGEYSSANAYIRKWNDPSFLNCSLGYSEPKNLEYKQKHLLMRKSTLLERSSKILDQILQPWIWSWGNIKELLAHNPWRGPLGDYGHAFILRFNEPSYFSILLSSANFERQLPDQFLRKGPNPESTESCSSWAWNSLTGKFLQGIIRPSNPYVFQAWLFAIYST